MLASGAHVSIGGVEYMLAIDEEPHYVHRFESLFAPTSAIAGEIAKEQVRPEKLLWAITDWSGGEGARIYYPQDPTTYDVASLMNPMVRGMLSTRPRRFRSSVARAGASAITGRRPAGTSAYKYALIGWADNILYSQNALGWTAVQDGSPDQSTADLASAISDGTNAAFLPGTGGTADAIATITAPTSPAAWADTQSGAAPDAPIVGAVVDGVPYTFGPSAANVLTVYKKAAVMTTLADWAATLIYSTGTSVANQEWGTDYWTSATSAETAMYVSYSTKTHGFIWEIRADVGRPFWTGDPGFCIRKLIYKAGILFAIGNQKAAGRQFAGIWAIPLATRSPIFIAAPRKHRNTEFSDFSVGCPGPGNTVICGDAFSGKIFVYDIEKDALHLLDDLANGGTGDGMSFTSGQNLLSANEASVETSVTPWTAGANTTLVQSAAAARHGSSSMYMDYSASPGEATATTATGVSGIPVLPSTAYTAFAYFRAVTDAGNCRVKIIWYDSSGNVISTSTGSDTADVVGSWTQATVSATSPSTAAFAAVTVAKTFTTANYDVYIDSISFHQGSSIGDLDSIAFLAMHGTRLFGATWQPLGINTSLQVFAYDDFEIDNRDTSQAISATLETGEWDFGLPMEQKALVGFYVTYKLTDATTTSGLLANSRIKVSYSMDDAAYVDTTVMTSATTPVGGKGRHFIQVSSGSSTAKFTRLKVKITLDNNATAGVAPPVLYGVTVEAQPLAYAETWDLAIRVEDEESNERPTSRQNEAAFMRDSLEDLATNKSIVTLLDGYRYKQPNRYTSHVVMVEDPGDTIVSPAEGVMRVRLRSVLSA